MNKLKNIAIITARSGSKGLPDKNIRELCGKPLIAYSIEAAIESGVFDTVMVSTDSEKYADISEKYGAEIPFLRSEEMSSDSAGSWDTVREVLDRYEERGQRFDTVCLLQPTSPLRTFEDIQAAYRLFEEKNADSVIGVCEAEHTPLWMNKLDDSLRMDGFIPEEIDSLPRQALPTYYRINGAIYIVSVSRLRSKESLYDNGYAYVMPAERSVDIDGIIDFKLAETLMGVKDEDN